MAVQPAHRPHSAGSALNSPEENAKISPLAAMAIFLRHVRHAWAEAIAKEKLEDQKVVVTIPASFGRRGSRSDFIFILVDKLPFAKVFISFVIVFKGVNNLSIYKNISKVQKYLKIP